MAISDMSMVYDLGQHSMEISPEGVLLIANGADGHPLKEITQLDNEEVYRLFLALQEWFREEREKECSSLNNM